MAKFTFRLFTKIWVAAATLFVSPAFAHDIFTPQFHNAFTRFGLTSTATKPSGVTSLIGVFDVFQYEMRWHDTKAPKTAVRFMPAPAMIPKFQANEIGFSTSRLRQFIPQTTRVLAPNPIYSYDPLMDSIRFSNEIDPMLGLGYDLVRQHRFTFAAEVGGVFIGGLDAIGRSTALGINADIVDNPEINDELGELYVRPYISILASFRF